ncbi:MAG TPA: isoprenylcysteine carboxylmethyltransferase family protein [Nitrososphaerales archaeon]|nr:isoprenylcysteine carboxylmethyltransferase family protein [Nitrososphaerales archaeon]
MAGRTEPLVVSGPQKYTRNPLYFGVVLILFGWAVYAASPFPLRRYRRVRCVVALVLIPYEERELKALFGSEWTRYSAETPMLFPCAKRRKKND